MSIAETKAPEVLENARANAAGFPISTLAFLKQRGIPAREWVEFVGDAYASGWAENTGQMGQIARYVKLNWENCGGDVREVTFDDHDIHAAIVWPAGEAAEFAKELGLVPDDTVAMFHIFGPIAERLGLRLTIEPEADVVHLRLHAS